MKIVLLYGGQSAEHDISVISAYNILQAIIYETYEVQPIYIKKDGSWLKPPLLKKAPESSESLFLEEAQAAAWATQAGEKSTGVCINPGDIKEDNVVVFPVLHGPNGEDGTVQGFLEVLKLPYVGAGVVASATGMDKVVSKHLFDQAGIPQVPYVAFDARDWSHDQDEWVQKCEGNLIYPLFVKPANMGSSVGISKVNNTEELIEGVNYALKYDKRVVVEQGIQAEECEVGVLGNDDPHVSVVGRLVKEESFYDYEEKYINNTVEMEIPAHISEEATQKIQDYALRAYQAIDGCGLSRVDFFVTSSEDIYINEINTMPGFTPVSMYPSLWEKTGLSYVDLIEELIQLALSRYEKMQALKTENGR